MLPEDLQRVLWEFAGPWTLKEAMKTCYENVNPNLSPWDVTTVNWKTAFRGPDGERCSFHLEEFSTRPDNYANR